MAEKVTKIAVSDNDAEKDITEETTKDNTQESTAQDKSPEPVKVEETVTVSGEKRIEPLNQPDNSAEKNPETEKPTDPKNKVNRTYIATLRGEITTEKCQKLVNGLQMEQEILQAQSCEILKASGRESRVKIVLTEGKNREIRRMMEALNHEVTALKRISYGSLELGPLPVGKYRLFSEPELTALFPAYFTNRRHSFQ
jgi:hypothetical protein